jgi:hypothetical protein
MKRALRHADALPFLLVARAALTPDAQAPPKCRCACARAADAARMALIATPDAPDVPRAAFDAAMPRAADAEDASSTPDATRYAPSP